MPLTSSHKIALSVCVEFLFIITIHHTNFLGNFITYGVFHGYILKFILVYDALDISTVDLSYQIHTVQTWNCLDRKLIKLLKMAYLLLFYFIFFNRLGDLIGLPNPRSTQRITQIKSDH